MSTEDSVSSRLWGKRRAFATTLLALAAVGSLEHGEALSLDHRHSHLRQHQHLADTSGRPDDGGGVEETDTVTEKVEDLITAEQKKSYIYEPYEDDKAGQVEVDRPR